MILEFGLGRMLAGVYTPNGNCQVGQGVPAKVDY
jgi:hypothetical protein